MDITTTHLGLTAELRIQGRVDTFWADHLREAIDYTLEQGARNVRLHLAEVDYLSSAGIRSVLAAYKKIDASGGRMEIVQPSASARSILEMAGLDGLIQGVTDQPAPAAEATEIPTTNGMFHVHDLGGRTSMQCALVGSPGGLRSGLFHGNDARDVLFPESTFGVGLGAFGHGYEDCRGRHGEFIAIGGAAAYQPTDGTDVPEYMVSEGDWVPELNVLYALWGQGRFTRLLRFDAKPDPGHVPFEEILTMALAQGESDTVGIAMIAETDGLMGVGLKRSITDLKNLEAPLSFREVRKTLAGAPTRLTKRMLTVIAGVATINPPKELAPVFSHVVPGSDVTGHFNAMVFPRHSVEDGVIDLHRTVQMLCASETLADVVHLLPDESKTGVDGQSHFLRGACWVAPIDSIGFEAE